MTEKDKLYLNHLQEIVDLFLQGKRIKINSIFFDSADSAEIQMLYNKSQLLIKQYNDSFDFVLDLSKGKLDVEPPQKNSYANAFKQLQSELRHLTWQIQEIAKGDYDQKVSFSGDFSNSINIMIESLKEKQRLTDLNIEINEKYKMLAENTVDCIWILDLTTLKYKYISPSIFKLRGKTVEEAMNESLSDSLTPESLQKVNDMTATRLEKFISGDQSDNIIERVDEFQQYHANGSIIDVEISTKLILDTTNNTILTLGVSRDITQKKKLEREIQQKNHELEYLNNSKDKFFSIIAHDLKNPFNGLLGVSELLLKHLEKNELEKVRLMADILNESSERGYKLLTNLLEWSRLQTGRLEMDMSFIKLSDIIIENIALFKTNTHEKNITITFSNVENQMVYADRNMLNTVVRNLLSNAIKYTHPNGEININVELHGKKAHISIEDNGIGINTINLEKLFRIDVTFRLPGTNNEKGTGLGLILCKDFINRQGGEIWVESKIGTGTKFTFSVRLL